MKIGMKSRQMGASAAIAAALALGMNLPALSGPMFREPDEIERQFLAGLKGGARDIWARRIRRGLTPAEKAFIKERITE